MSRYERVKTLASGGQGSASLWRDTVEDELFVVKEFKNEESWMRERDNLTSFPEHENIVKIYHSEEALPLRDNPYLCFEYAPRGDVLDFVKAQYEGQPLTEEQLRCFATQLLKALQHLKNYNIIHKDIKPQNILVFDVPGSRNGGGILVKLTDFGIARHTDSTTVHFGSVPYMAPEQLGSSPESDVTGGSSEGSDLWSLGATLTELATAKVPWSDQVSMRGLPLMEYLKRGCGQEGFHPTIPSTLSLEAKAFLTKCFAAHPLNRGTCAQLLDHPFITGQELSNFVVSLSFDDGEHRWQCVSSASNLCKLPIKLPFQPEASLSSPYIYNPLHHLTEVEVFFAPPEATTWPRD